ncbi:DMT family transporter [Corallococcus sp. AB011P]|uniref:DMT family transporter n=1 Tax=Corallococcus sp. AB011P TaxID=2316735 RepID=UPI001F3CD5B0|nr:DMT family transporter [Corallococcus sp. AB011P]
MRAKALGSGTCTFVLAWLTGQPFPAAQVLGAALVLGFASYGLSIVLDAYALRLLGAAREAAYFATVPFVGALVAVPLLGERLRPLDLLEGVLMAASLVLLLRSTDPDPRDEGHGRGRERTSDTHASSGGFARRKAKYSSTS